MVGQMNTTNTALEVAKVHPTQVMPRQESFIPSQQEWGFMVAWGRDAIRAGLLPAAIKNAEAAALVILKGRELGIPFMTAVAHIHIINGKPCMSAELLQAMARKNLPGLLINVTNHTSETCTVELTRPEKGSKMYPVTWTITDAQNADLLKNPTWKKYPKAMLFSRAVSAGLRVVCPEALMGVSYTPEEMGADVNESGDVIETTGRTVTDDKPADVPPPKAPEPPKEQMDPVRKEMIQKILECQKVLGFTNDEMKEDLHKIFAIDSLKALSVDQLKKYVSVLEEDIEGRDGQSKEAQWSDNQQQTLGVPT